jgi:hypothetical protein
MSSRKEKMTGKSRWTSGDDEREGRDRSTGIWVSTGRLGISPVVRVREGI